MHRTKTAGYFNISIFIENKMTKEELIEAIRKFQGSQPFFMRVRLYNPIMLTTVGEVNEWEIVVMNDPANTKESILLKNSAHALGKYLEAHFNLTRVEFVMPIAYNDPSNSGSITTHEKI